MNTNKLNLIISAKKIHTTELSLEEKKPGSPVNKRPSL